MKKRNLTLEDLDNAAAKNHQRIKRPLPFFFNYLIAVGLITILFLFLNVPDAFTVNQATILGIAGSTLISLYVLFITSDRDKRDKYLEARTNAKLLSQMLHSVNTQLLNIEKGNVHPVTYSSNWIENFQKCVMYLEYDYFEYLLREFEIVEQINNAIASGAHHQIQNLLNYREKSITDWCLDFDILSVTYNLNTFALGFRETKPWKVQKQYREFKEFFVSTYSEQVKKLTKTYLLEHGGTCNSLDAEYYVLGEIRKEAGLQTRKYQYITLENKAVLLAISAVYSSLNENDSISRCWGELTLNETAK